jgi:predicted lipase
MKTVSPNKTDLDAGNAYWMARLSKEVYLKKSETDQKPDEEKILSNIKKDDGKFVAVYGYDNNSAQAALIEHEEFLCMAFRGTDELADWLDNFNALSTEVLFGEFHRGFWDSVGDIWEPMYAKYEALMEQRKRPLFLTGHSLGGAMTSVAVAKLIHDNIPFTSAYTFGQPRCMSDDTAEIFNKKCKERYFRFHNNNDIVTRIPARAMGYSHIGTYLYITEEETIHPKSSFWFRFMDYVDGAINALTEEGVDAIEDHDMANYLRAVDKWDLKD